MGQEIKLFHDVLNLEYIKTLRFSFQYLRITAEPTKFKFSIFQIFFDTF